MLQADTELLYATFQRNFRMVLYKAYIYEKFRVIEENFKVSIKLMMFFKMKSYIIQDNEYETLISKYRVVSRVRRCGL